MLTQGIRLALFGAPGAGKGTQAKLLKEKLRVTHISSGELFRRNLQNRTPLGLTAAEYMEQGLLVPDKITIDIVLESILSINSENGFILDGFPRNLAQAQALEEALKRRSRDLDKVAHIDVPESELVRRLGGRFNCSQCQTPYSQDHLLSTRLGEVAGEDGTPCCAQCGGELYQRADDSPEAVQRRLEVYRNETAPVLDFYRERGLLLEVSGSESIGEVNQRMVDLLDLERHSEDNRAH